MSDMEIDEIVEEISGDFDDYLETEKEKIKEEITEAYDKEMKSLKNNSEFPCATIQDMIVLEWMKQNLDLMKKLERLNKSSQEIYEMYQYGEKMAATSLKWNKVVEAASEVSNFVDQEIKQAAHNLAHKRIILVGKAASGKDHARKLFTEKGFKYATSYTTRPPRVGEVEGEDYYFFSKESFETMVSQDKFYEHVTFNNWRYGTTRYQFNHDNVFIMTPHGISKIRESDRDTCFIIYFDIEESIRKERLSKRSDADTVDRRLEADSKDFENFFNFDLRITNPNF
jgi:guanylate kinase